MRVLCMGQQTVAGKQLGYYLLAEEDEAETERYGVKIESEDGEFAEVLNVTVSGVRIQELLDLLIRNTVTPLTLRDVVDDWL